MFCISINLTKREVSSSKTHPIMKLLISITNCFFLMNKIFVYFENVQKEEKI